MPCFFKKMGWQSLLHGKININLTLQRVVNEKTVQLKKKPLVLLCALWWIHRNPKEVETKELIVQSCSNVSVFFCNTRTATVINLENSQVCGICFFGPRLSRLDICQDSAVMSHVLNCRVLQGVIAILRAQKLAIIIHRLNGWLPRTENWPWHSGSSRGEIQGAALYMKQHAG